MANPVKYSTRYAAVFNAWLRQAPYLAIGAVIAASAMVYGAGMQAKRFATSMSGSANVDLNDSITLQKVPVAPTEYAPMTTFCHQHAPDVRCEVVSGKLVISIGDPSKYEDWIFATSSVSSFGKNFVWEPKRLCIGQCDGMAAIVELTAYTQRVTVK